MKAQLFVSAAIVLLNSVVPGVFANEIRLQGAVSSSGLFEEEDLNMEFIGKSDKPGNRGGKSDKPGNRGGKSDKDDRDAGGKSDKDDDDDYAKSGKRRSRDDDDYSKSGKADRRFCRACVREEVRVFEGRRVSSAFRSRSVLRQCDDDCGTRLVREFGKSGKAWIDEDLNMEFIGKSDKDDRDAGGKSDKDDRDAGGKSDKDDDDDYAKSGKRRSRDDDDYSKSGKADRRFCRECVREEVRVLQGRRVSSAFRSSSVLRQCDDDCGTRLVRHFGKSGKAWIDEDLNMEFIGKSDKDDRDAGGKSDKDDRDAGGKSDKDDDDDYSKSGKSDDDDYSRSGKAGGRRFCRECADEEVRVLRGRSAREPFDDKDVQRQCDDKCGIDLRAAIRSGKGGKEDYATDFEEDFYVDIE